MRVYRVVYSTAAKSDIQILFAFIAARAGHAVASGYVRRLTAACTRLQHAPNRGTLRRVNGRVLRRIGFERRAAIAFEVDESEGIVTIVGVYYGGRESS